MFELNRVLYRPLEAPLELVDATIEDQYRNVVDERIDDFLDGTVQVSDLETGAAAGGTAQKLVSTVGSENDFIPAKTNDSRKNCFRRLEHVQRKPIQFRRLKV